MRIRKRKASAQPFDKRRVGRGVRKLSLVILRGGGLGRAIRNFRQAASEPDEIDITPKDKEKIKTDEEKKA